jgi:hypothetical protein
MSTYFVTKVQNGYQVMRDLESPYRRSENVWIAKDLKEVYEILVQIEGQEKTNGEA